MVLMKLRTRLICIDNVGISSSYGDLSKIFDIGTPVTYIATFGCCYHVQLRNGETYVLNRERFKVDDNK